MPKLAPGTPICGARNRQGELCQHKAGWGTPHLGEGHCKLHGGLTYTHGYSMVRATDPKTQNLVKHLEQLIQGDPHAIFSQVDMLALENVAVLMRQRKRLSEFLDEHGMSHKSSAKASELLNTTTNALLGHLNSLALTPTSRAKLGVDLTRGFDLAEALAASGGENQEDAVDVTPSADGS